jgi:ArsR family transcriptional regulator, arsenate/arsenite/antimonite-responsive transcriptional repressor
MNESDAVSSLGALAHPARLRVFRALVVAGTGGMTPGAITGSLGTPPSTLSFHLKELMAAGLVTQERASRHLVYRAAFDRMNELLGYLTENCCAGGTCAVSPSVAPCDC